MIVALSVCLIILVIILIALFIYIKVLKRIILNLSTENALIKAKEFVENGNNLSSVHINTN